MHPAAADILVRLDRDELRRIAAQHRAVAVARSRRRAARPPAPVIRALHAVSTRVRRTRRGRAPIRSAAPDR
jgi:hypothetical protein